MLIYVGNTNNLSGKILFYLPPSDNSSTFPLLNDEVLTVIFPCRLIGKSTLAYPTTTPLHTKAAPSPTCASPYHTSQNPHYIPPPPLNVSKIPH